MSPANKDRLIICVSDTVQNGNSDFEMDSDTKEESFKVKSLWMF